MKRRTFNKKESAGLDVLRIVWKNGKESGTKLKKEGRI